MIPRNTTVDGIQKAVHDCLYSTTQGPRLMLRLRFAVGWVGLVWLVAKERRQLTRLSASQRHDLGVDGLQVTREAGRSLFDLPARRLDDLKRRVRRQHCTRGRWSTRACH